MRGCVLVSTGRREYDVSCENVASTAYILDIVGHADILLALAELFRTPLSFPGNLYIDAANFVLPDIRIALAIWIDPHTVLGSRDDKRFLLHGAIL